MRSTAKKTFWESLKATDSDTARFCVAFPLLLLLPVTFEFLQHLAEIHIGMYDSITMAKSVEHHPVRMVFGLLKIAALIIPGFWVARFLGLRDRRRVTRLEQPALRLSAGVFAFSMLTSAISLFILPLAGVLQLPLMIGWMVAGFLFAAWSAAAPLGNTEIGFSKSIAVMLPRLPWSVAFGITAFMPLMIPHYVLGALALLGPHTILWPTLMADALLVGPLTVLLAASNFHIAVRALGGIPTGAEPDFPARASA